MPLPLGHAAIGWAAHDLSRGNQTALAEWKTMFFVFILANLPDVDVLVGLLLHGNGSSFHRGPTHSLLFAFLAGWGASRAWRIWSPIPRLGFGICFLVIFSHVVSDLFLTTAPVSMFWPLEVNWTMGFSGWEDVFGTVFLKAFQDSGIMLACGLVIFVKHLILRFPVYYRPGWAFQERQGKKRTRP